MIYGVEILQMTSTEQGLICTEFNNIHVTHLQTFSENPQQINEPLRCQFNLIAETQQLHVSLN